MHFDMLSHLITVNGVTIYRNHLKFHESILNLEVYDDDVWLASFPKSGTTWTQEMVWLISNGLDYVKAQETIWARFPFLELSSIFPILNMPDRPEEFNPSERLENSVKFVQDFRRPRFIKTHLPWKLLPLQIQNGFRKPKIIYVARNPKDVCISYYYHLRSSDGYSGTIEEFCELFLCDRMLYCPYWENLLSFWNRRNEDNIIFMKYEDMKVDLPSVINKVSHFLGKQLSREELDKLAAHLSFESMKNNKAVNNEEALAEYQKFNISPFPGKLLRSGTIGSYRVDMSDDMIDRFDQWIEESTAGTGLKFTC